MSYLPTVLTPSKYRCRWWSPVDGEPNGTFDCTSTLNDVPTVAPFVGLTTSSVIDSEPLEPSELLLLAPALPHAATKSAAAKIVATPANMRRPGRTGRWDWCLWLVLFMPHLPGHPGPRIRRNSR